MSLTWEFAVAEKTPSARAQAIATAVWFLVSVLLMVLSF
jgi:hypothetical protein